MQSENRVFWSSSDKPDNTDTGINAPTKAFLIPYQVASPLVVWPAVEWYFPPIPFTGYLSVGTLVLMGILGRLIDRVERRCGGSAVEYSRFCGWETALFRVTRCIRCDCLLLLCTSFLSRPQCPVRHSRHASLLVVHDSVVIRWQYVPRGKCTPLLGSFLQSAGAPQSTVSRR